MRTPEISVIIPVHNCVKYLREVIEDLRLQEQKDYEVILIDDGSTDHGGALCDDYAIKDPRVRVIHQEKGGVSRARNRGLDEAQGEYIVFVDADDRIRPQYLYDLICAKRRLDAAGQRSLIISDYQPFSDNGTEARCFPEPFSIDFSNRQGVTADHFRQLVFQFLIFPPYCKLYRRDVIEENEIRFLEEIKSAEDFAFNMRYLSVIDRVEYINSVQYSYRVGYKKYIPSNHGILGKSEICSAHIMANGITDLAKRMGVLDEVEMEINLWAAKKHYLNRLRMLFRKSGQISVQEKKKLYDALISDAVYYSAAKRGARMLPKSATRMIAENMDSFYLWLAFYQVHKDEAELT